VTTGVWAGATRRVQVGLAGLVCAIAAGCSSPPKPVVTTVAGSIEASPRLNPSINQRPSPLLMRVYELRTPAAFSNADFMALYQSDQAALATDMVAREEFMLQPGENRAVRKTLAADTRYIGVLGIYRNLEKATWRAVVPVQVGKAQTLTVKAGELAVTVEVKP
jgi:type VI secretion system protein VasD